MPRLVLLADATNPHTRKWALEFRRRAWDVRVLSLHPGEIPGVAVEALPRILPGKLGYPTATRHLARRIRELAPDVLHAHYATSYGLLGALTGFHPFVLSVWGADVYDFPAKSPLHRWLLERNLAAADVLCSTSHAMAAWTSRFAPGRAITIVPFGVDCVRFAPAPGAGPAIPTIGLAKALEPKYGHEVLVRALALLRERLPGTPVQLEFAGEGFLRPRLEALVQELGLADRVTFRGRLAPDEIPGFLAGLTLFAMPSVEDSESFGVAAVEAAACALPVVASRVGGVPEVVIDGVTGLLVPPRDPEALAGALGELVADPARRVEMGAAGRALVLERYDWRRNADQMEEVYGRVREQACGSCS